jgi:hypothetical protein
MRGKQRHRSGVVVHVCSKDGWLQCTMSGRQALELLNEWLGAISSKAEEDCVLVCVLYSDN